MKFIRIVVIIGVFSTSLSCSKRNYDLSGTWIGAYYFNPNSSFKSKSPLNWFVEVSNDELKVSTLKVDGIHAPNRLTSLKYRQKGNQLFIYYDDGVDSVEIVSKNDKRVVLRYHEEGKTKFIFKLFTRGPSPKMSTLSGKSFHLFSKNYSDSISFINESMFINISRDAVRGTRWAATSVHDYRFLLLGEFAAPPLYVKSIMNDTITLENFGAGNKYIYLVGLKEKYLSLEGHWEEVGRINKGNLPPPPGNGKMELTFDADSCEIFNGAKLIKRRWRLNSTSEILYFDEIVNAFYQDWAWYVERTGDSLIIDRHILFKDPAIDYDPGEKIIFKKQE